MTKDISGMNFLYVISSGNDDDIYKIGISVHPVTRLEQIKRDYDVPNAYIVETMDVPTRDEVFAIESALHEQFDRYRARHMKGKEWFKLSKTQLKQLISMCQQKSNDFAQATAYMGLIEAALKIQDQAEAEESQRQIEITMNRRHGKTYDTKPKGLLKRYNDLMAKVKRGTLAERFDLVTRPHPLKELQQKATSSISDIVEQKLKGLWWKLGATGYIATLVVVGSVGTPEDAFGSGMFTGALASIAGALNKDGRKDIEVKEAEQKMITQFNARFPGILKQQQVLMKDQRKNKSFLVRDYTESKMNLRNQPALTPHVPSESMEVANQIAVSVKNKAIIPLGCITFTAIVVAIMGTLVSQENARLEERAFMTGQQVTQHYLSSPHLDECCGDYPEA